MSNSEKTLKKKELSFCYHYIETGNAFEAAKLAGYKNNVRSKAIKLLESSKIAKKIEDMEFPGASSSNALYATYSPAKSKTGLPVLIVSMSIRITSPSMNMTFFM